LKQTLRTLREKAASPEELAFHTSNGTPFNDSNLFHRDLKPTDCKLGMAWLNWHTLRRTHATLFQFAGGSQRDAQAQLGHSKMCNTLIEKLAGLMADDGRNGRNPEGLPLASQQIHRINGRPEWTRTIDLFRVKEAL
jgi:integrase